MISITDNRTSKQVEHVVYLIAGALLVPVFVAMAIGRDNLILFYAAAVGACVVILFPRLCLYLFLLLVSVYYPTFVGRVAIHPFDLGMLLVAASVLLGNMLRGKNAKTSTRIDRYFGFMIFATVLSAIFAYDFSYSIVPCIRMVVIFVAFRILYSFALEIGIHKLTRFFVYHVFALSLINLALFIMTGGQQRIFGPAWLAFETYSMTALPIAIAFILWTDSLTERIKFSLMALTIGLALLATQSRAPLLAIVIAVPTLFLAAYLKTSSLTKRSAGSVLRKAVIPVIALIVLALVFRESFFEGAFTRVASLIESLKNPQETVYLRLVLWTAAWKAFISHPITGIGIGNFKIVGDIITEMKFAPPWYYIEGMSAHNIIFHYMAETGIVGTAAILALAFINLKVAIQSFKRSFTTLELQMSAAAFIAIFVFCVTILYMRAWTWGQDGYIMAFLFAINVAWNARLRQKQAAVKAV